MLLRRAKNQEILGINVNMGGNCGGGGQHPFNC